MLHMLNKALSFACVRLFFFLFVCFVISTCEICQYRWGKYKCRHSKLVVNIHCQLFVMYWICSLNFCKKVRNDQQRKLSHMKVLVLSWIWYWVKVKHSKTDVKLSSSLVTIITSSLKEHCLIIGQMMQDTGKFLWIISLKCQWLKWH